MRKAEVYVNKKRAGVLIAHQPNFYEFIYDEDYSGHPISLTMPVHKKKFEYALFPSFFEGLLPEGHQLEALLRTKKINRDDYFSQLMVCGQDAVGAVSVKEIIA